MQKHTITQIQAYKTTHIQAYKQAHKKPATSSVTGT